MTTSLSIRGLQQGLQRDEHGYGENGQQNGNRVVEVYRREGRCLSGHLEILARGGNGVFSTSSLPRPKEVVPDASEGAERVIA